MRRPNFGAILIASLKLHLNLQRVAGKSASLHGDISLLSQKGIPAEELIWFGL